MPKKTSPWLDSVPDIKRYPELDAAILADVVVIGAGLAGIMTAWRLAQQGKKVVLLEQNHVATGDTGYTTAFLTRVPDTSSAVLAEKHGIEFVKNTFTAMAGAQRFIIDLIKQEQIDCDLVEYPSYNCSYTPNSVALQKEWAVVQQVDPQAEWVSGETEAIKFNGEASYHVRKFMFGLLARPSAQSMQIFEESPVTEVIVEKQRVIVTTPKGKVVCQQVVLTAGLPFQFTEFHKLYTTKITYALTARYPEKSPLASAMFWDVDVPYQYYRTIDNHSVMIGGMDHIAGEPATGTISPHDALADWLDKHFPGKTEVDLVWSGSLFETEDGLPYVSSHPQYPHQVYFACGFGGNGMVGSVLASDILAQLVLTQSHPAQAIFSLQRNKVTLGKATPHVRPGVSLRVPIWKRFVQVAVILLWLSVFATPGYLFVQARGGLGFFQGLDFKTFCVVIFPVIGLYAFTLVWSQIVLGAAMNFWRSIFKHIETFHRAEGAFALLFALTHPTLIAVGYGLQVYFARTYVAPENLIYLYLGYFQLILMCCTVGTALLMKTKWFKRKWHYIHYLNYIVFISVWVHSWFLGSDVRFSNLWYLWISFAVTVVIATLYRIISEILMAKKRVAASAIAAPTGEYVLACSAADVVMGKAHMVTVKGIQIALFNFNGKYYAMENLCSHAGGPLCNGPLNDKVVECPWHGSQFDITTGAVITGPARRAQRTFPVKLEGEQLLVQL